MRVLLYGLLLLLSPRWAMAQEAPPAGPFRVAGVAIEGARITKPRVILRELTLAEGDTLDTRELYARIERSTQNLRNLSLFNSVEVMPLFLGPQDVFITVTVNERWYWWPEPIFRVADPNFNTWWLTRDLRRVNFGAYLNRYNFRGRNETVYVKFQLGYTKELAMRYRIPFADRKERWGFSIGGGYAEQNEVTVATVDNKRVFARYEDREVRTERKVELQATLRRSHDVRHGWKLGYVHAGVSDTVRRATNDYFRNDAADARYLSLGYQASLDRRDSRVFPLKGYLLEMRVDRLGLGLLSQDAPDVTIVQAAVERLYKLKPRWSVGAGLRGRTTLEQGIPYYNQEGLGYGTNVRGYEYYIVDGQHAAVGKANVLFALVQPREYYLQPIPLEAFRTLYVAVYLHAFADVGYAWDDRYAARNPLANSVLSGYGVGLDLVSSYDQVLRLEYTLNGRSETGFYLHFNQPF